MINYCPLNHAIEGRNVEEFHGRAVCRACSTARNRLRNSGCQKPSASLFELEADGAFMGLLGWTAHVSFRPGNRGGRWSRDLVSVADSRLGERTHEHH